MKSIYSNEISSLKPIREIVRFGKQHLINFFKRIVYQYFLLDFNIGSLELFSGILLSFLLFFTSLKVYLKGSIDNELATPGEANLIGLLAIVIAQLFIGFLYYDSTQQPLMRKLKSNKY